MSHTPGPWTVGHCQADDRGLSISADGVPVCDLYDGEIEDGNYYALPYLNCEANAEFIAAAPETAAERDRLREKLNAVREALEKIVCTAGEDAGVVLLSNDGPTHYDQDRCCEIYELEYFSPLGEALMAAWKLAGGKERKAGG